ncbi:collagen-binding domain-containing protein [Liquorilactobacillus sicerae]|uniref:collagen-binding domain-containing protein n=1 Tax=Liquorilactobacillus sicerae TaxID=1416943 RepID=UPI002480B68D|nr:collagen-binding domain-containing protein [Liquorilactobacillus sicerae]
MKQIRREFLLGLICLFSGLFIFNNKTINANSTTFSSGGTAVQDFPGVQDNPLDIASVFHIFAEEAELNAHTDGNLAVQNLDGQANFGTNIHEGLVKQDVSYIQQVTSIAASSFVADQGDQTNKVIFGKDVELGTTDNGNAVSVNGQKMDHLKVNEVYQDSQTEQYIDFDQEFAKLNENSDKLAAETPAKTYQNADFPDQNQRVINVASLTPNQNNQIVINLASDVLASNTPLTITGISKAKDAPMIVFNVENDGQLYVVNSKIILTYADDSTRSNHETEDFSDAHLLWNFTNTQKDQEIDFNAPFQGSVLAPNANLTINQNLDGNIVGRKVVVNAETHRWDLQSNSTTTSDSSTTGTTTTGSSSDSSTTGTTTTGSSSDSSTTGTTTGSSSDSSTTGTTTGSSSDSSTTGTTTTGLSNDSNTTGTTTTGSSSDSSTTGTTTTGSSSDSSTTGTTTGSSSDSSTTGTTTTGLSSDSNTTGTTTTGTSTSNTTGTTTTGSSSNSSTTTTGSSFSSTQKTDTTQNGQTTSTNASSSQTSSNSAFGLGNGIDDNNNSGSLPQTDQTANHWAIIVGVMAIIAAIAGLVILQKSEKQN